MQKRRLDEKGFTLIEIIVTLVLVGITAAMAGMWIVSVANGYIFAKVNAKTAQNAQLAMTRLVKEFTAIRSVTSTIPTPTQIEYTRLISPLGSVPMKVSQNGEELRLSVAGVENILTDSVVSNGGFTLQYYNADGTSCETAWSSASRIIEITLTLTGGNNTPVTFVQRVAPRNL